jgi:LytS/YehU family sensor histidine kinase
MILHPLVENAVKYCGYDKNKANEGSIRVDITISKKDVLISIENTLGLKDLSNNIGFKKGVETVQESITIYNKMGHYQLKFNASVNPIHFNPGFRCEIIVLRN